MAARVRSFCKINLGLAVGPARADGFHGLTTMYQTLALHDLVTVTARPAAQTRIMLTANHPGVPRTETGDAEKNTAFRMVADALRRLGIRAEVTIDLDKRLPVQGGLGAGSANAVAALLGLERELAQHGILPLPSPERLLLAEEVGSDVPLFLLGGTVLGLGRGEQVSPLPDLPATHCVVAVPSVGVSTAAAFRELDARMAGARMGAPGPESRTRVPPVLEETKGLQSSEDARQEWATPNSLETQVPEAGPGAPGSSPRLLTSRPVVDKLEELSRVLAACYTQTGSWPSQVEGKPSGPDSGIAGQPGDLADLTGSPSNMLDGVLNPLLALVRTGIENDFEEVAFTQHPSLRSTKRDLVGGAPGETGTALYAALSGSGSALFGLYRSLGDAGAAQQRVQRNGTAAFLTETLPRAEYWKRMFA